MKLIIFLLVICFCGFKKTALGQQNIQFIYIGVHPWSHEDILITSGGFRGDYLKSNNSRLSKIYYTDRRTLDTLRAYISRSKWVSRSDASRFPNALIDTAKFMNVYKITGTDSGALYVIGKDCFELFESAWDYLAGVGLAKTAGSNAMHQLKLECDIRFSNQKFYFSRSDSSKDSFRRLNPKANVYAKPNN